MKSITKMTFTFLTCLLFFSSCGNEKTKYEVTKDEITGTIDYERAAQLQKNYIETRANFLNAYLDSISYFKKGTNNGLVSSKGKNELIEDVRDVTFDLEVLKKYIAYVEKEAENKGLKGLGLRVYLGAYPKNDTIVDSPGFTTVFFMPTHQPNPTRKKADNFFYWNDDEIIEDTDGLNLGHAGSPPKDNDLN